MLAMKPQMIVVLADLRYVSIACETCRTKVVLDMVEPSAFSQKHGFFAPRKCPSCQSDYDTAVVRGLDELQKVYAILNAKPGPITFHGEPENAN